MRRLHTVNVFAIVVVAVFGSVLIAQTERPSRLSVCESFVRAAFSDLIRVSSISVTLNTGPNARWESSPLVSVEIHPVEQNIGPANAGVKR